MTTQLPIIDRSIDNTALSAYMKCPREYDFAMRRGLKSKERSQALSFGAFWHKLLEVHYKTNGNETAVLDAFLAHEKSVPKEGDYRTAKRAWVEYQKYRKTYPPSFDCTQTLGAPDSPMVEINTSVASEVIPQGYAGKLDRIVLLNPTQALIEDHKTTSRLDKHYFNQFTNSNQMKGYVWIGQKIVPSVKVIGVRINLLHILTEKSQLEQHVVTFSDSMIREWEENTARWLKRIERSIVEEDFPAHFGDNGCKHLYGKCQFFEVCATNSMIREATISQDFKIEHWDPLKHEDE